MGSFTEPQKAGHGKRITAELFSITEYCDDVLLLHNIYFAHGCIVNIDPERMIDGMYRVERRKICFTTFLWKRVMMTAYFHNSFSVHCIDVKKC